MKPKITYPSPCKLLFQTSYSYLVLVLDCEQKRKEISNRLIEKI